MNKRNYTVHLSCNGFSPCPGGEKTFFKSKQIIGEATATPPENCEHLTNQHIQSRCAAVIGDQELNCAEKDTPC